MSKVVCLSLGRNGTQSLTDFLVSLNYKTIHWIDQKDYQKSFSINSKYELNKYIESFEQEYDAFTDISFAISYDFFNKKYSDAMFILITRDIDSWIRSMRRHIQSLENMMNLKIIHPIVKTVYSQYVNVDNKLMSQITDDEFKKIYTRHTETVLEYFKDSKNFLHIDLSDPDIDIKILDFLSINEHHTFPKKDYF
jgi:hypothetical protein